MLLKAQANLKDHLTAVILLKSDAHFCGMDTYTDLQTFEPRSYVQALIRLKVKILLSVSVPSVLWKHGCALEYRVWLPKERGYK